MKLQDIERRLARARLAYGHGTHSAREEAHWLWSSVLGSNFSGKPSEKDEARIERLLRRRIRERIPLAYLLREAWLGEHAFYVDERAIVPRSFIAELLRERLRPWLRREPERALDLCTGSGCLAVLLALTFRRARIDATDVSAEALEVARINVRKYRLAGRVRVVRSDLFASLKKNAYDLIVCNPPYVTARSMRRLPMEYRHEPAEALAGGRDGLGVVREILAKASRYLRPHGLLVCEIGGNRRALERACPGVPFVWPETSEGPGCVFILGREQLPPRTAGACGRRARRARAKR